MNISITKQVTKTEEISISAPAWFKDDTTHYLINKKGELLTVSASQITKWDMATESYNYYLNRALNAEPIAEGKFMEAYDATLSKIISFF